MSPPSTSAQQNALSGLLKSRVVAEADPRGVDDPFRLDRQVAVVTGGGTGLGYAIADAITQLGGRVAIVGRRADVLRDAADRLGDQVKAFSADVNDPAVPATLLERVSQDLDRPSILVNNAGIHLKRPSTETADRDFAEVMQTHVSSAFALSREFGRHMAEAGSGSILFITSMAAIFGIPDVSAYSAAKTAQVGLVRSLAVELAGRGVRVNGIAPGWIETPMSRKALNNDEQRRRRVIQRTPMGRMGRPEEIGRVAAFLCTDAASYINGAILPVDGGTSIGF